MRKNIEQASYENMKQMLDDFNSGITEAIDLAKELGSTTKFKKKFLVQTFPR